MLFYEARLNYHFWWPEFQAEMSNGIERAGSGLWILDRLHEKRLAPEAHELRGKGKLKKVRQAYTLLQEAINHITEEDFRRAGGPVPDAPNRYSSTIRALLIRDMAGAFATYGPPTFGPMARYRAIAAILNAFGVRNHQDGPFTAMNIKQIVRRGVDPRLEWNVISHVPPLSALR